MTKTEDVSFHFSSRFKQIAERTGNWIFLFMVIALFVAAYYNNYCLFVKIPREIANSPIFNASNVTVEVFAARVGVAACQMWMVLIDAMLLFLLPLSALGLIDKIGEEGFVNMFFCGRNSI